MNGTTGFDVADLLYMVASIFFIFGLKMLKTSRTARLGNLVSAIGMLVAIVTVLAVTQIISWEWVAIGLVAGSAIGAIAARRVPMTGMPGMVALFNGFGGLASLLVAYAEFEKIRTGSGPVDPRATLFVIGLTILIGGVTFTGSVLAWLKLKETWLTAPLVFRGQRIVNGIVLASLVALVLLLGPLAHLLSPGSLIGFVSPSAVVIALVIASGILGITSVIPIGGGDMPVVISLLNSYSGMAACSSGFVIGNSVLIVTGALVGASGIILTNIMCKAMNRSIVNVLFSGFGKASDSGGGHIGGKASVTYPVSAEDAAMMLEASRRVVFVPGYGMAVSQAQHAVKELAMLLESAGTDVDFAIHPVAGRMPGHMNVLLAEAGVPYDKLREMNDINAQMDSVDIAIVIGANDVVNPSARTDKTSPIYGMPIIDVDRAKIVIVLKRSMKPGFAQIENPLFYNSNTRMLFGDAKASLALLSSELKGM